MSDHNIFIKMTPRDLLFCRDAKPMESSWDGCGGFLPAPSTLFGAILSQMHNKMSQEESLKIASSLSTAGPFLCKDNEIYFPTPLDIIPGNKLLELKLPAGSSDLPQPLKYALFAGKPSKETVKPYISFSEFKKYLAGESFKLPQESDFFDREVRPGITINAKTRTAEDSKFYVAEYLRLREDEKVTLAARITLTDHEKLSHIFPADESVLMQLGGQQTMVYAERATVDFIPDAHITGKFVKWVLLTPAAWNKGWLPEFVDEASSEWNILLKACDGPKVERRPGEYRAAYRKRLAASNKPIAAKLIAARVGKPLAISGWKNQGSGGGSARATHLYVPAGAVYYFEAQDENEAQKLVKALHGRCLSTFGGRAGFGLGVCGNFTINE
ncbi:MAG: type III-B CRISPR module-associated protein Cmr3 [Lentisphaeria bacterium]|nr:type III-B CRISPR module-associated protein Cmr3 [Lentisphaeria bacterium]